MTNIGNKIKLIRENVNMSKSELSRKINVSPAYITMLENGTKKNPSIGVLNKISKVFNISIEQLLDCPKVDNDTMNIINKNNEKQEFENYIRDNIEDVKKLNSRFRDILYEMEANKSDILNNYNKEAFDKIVSMINDLPTNSNNLIEATQAYNKSQMENYTKLNLIKEHILDILKILQYDSNNLSDEFLNHLLEIIIRTIDFEIFNQKNKI